MHTRTNADRAWVSGQLLFMALIVAAAILGRCWHAGLVMAAAGVAVTVAGGLVMLWGGRTLGRALTIFPSPRSHYLERGPYRFVRHPMYGGGILMAFGIALASGPLTLVPALALVPFLVVKARYEERLLARANPGYGEYLARVRRRFFPGLL
jgi:protein-S-isoprenylcysteine O-methyltransferase Ste14